MGVNNNIGRFLFVKVIYAMISLKMKIWKYLRQRLQSVSIFNRVLIGNSLVIIFGAVFGTLLTRHFSVLGDIKLILLFSGFGILLTLLVNYYIIRSALFPLKYLSNLVSLVKEGQTILPESASLQADPAIYQLVLAIDSMLTRLQKRTLLLRAISERVINAQEEERLRIARGLHDDTAQALSILIIELERIENMMPENYPALAHRIKYVRDLANHSLEELRDVIWDLRPSILDDLGLIPAIRGYARTHLEDTGVQVAFNAPADMLRFSPALETMLFRIAQEALNNIKKHASADTVVISLEQDSTLVCLDVKDNGHGFDVERIKKDAVAHQQLGLLGIQERVSLVGGEIQIESIPGQGTHLHVCIPLMEEFSNRIEATRRMTAEVH